MKNTLRKSMAVFLIVGLLLAIFPLNVLSALTLKYHISSASVFLIDDSVNNDSRTITVTPAMEYRLSDEKEYTAVMGTEIRGLTSETYYVRYAAKTGYYAGADVEVIVSEYGAGGELSVTYDAGGGSGALPEDNTLYQENDSVTVLGGIGELTKGDDVFAGWNTAADGSGSCYAPGDTFSMGNENVILYAQWKDRVSFDYEYFNGHIYAVIPLNLSWQESKVYCEEIGGHLATITSGEENTFIASLVSQYNLKYYWLGATDKMSEGDWVWVTGESWTYNNWTSDNPNNDNPLGENYLETYRNGFWNDAFGLGPESYVVLECEDFELENHTVTYDGNGATSGSAPVDNVSYTTGESVTIPDKGSLAKEGFVFMGWNTAADGSGRTYTTGDTLRMGIKDVTFYARWREMPGDASEYFNGHHYKVINDGMSWSEARLYCQAMGGHLATITSPEEQAFLAGILSSGPQAYYWLGGTDADLEGNWQWITGEAWNYSNWTGVEPNNDGDGEECLMADPEGCWYDLDNRCLNHEYMGGQTIMGLVCEWEYSAERPVGLTATAVTSDSVTLYWDAMSAANGYKIYRATAESGPYTVIGTSTSNSFTDNGLIPGNTYWYKVSALINGEEGPVSEALSVTTQNQAVIQLSGPNNLTSEESSSIEVEVIRSGSLDNIVTINYFSLDGTAVQGEDYTALSGTLTFETGETSRTITIPILNDGIYEPDELFYLNLNNPGPGVEIGEIQQTGITIEDNDCMESTGAVVYLNFEGGFYGIMGDDGQKYRPVNQPRDIQDGDRVSYKWTTVEREIGFQMWGKAIRLLELEVTEHPNPMQIQKPTCPDIPSPVRRPPPVIEPSPLEEPIPVIEPLPVIPTDPIRISPGKPRKK